LSLEACGVTCGYVRNKPVLRDVSCGIGAGEVTAVVGPNGAGKSTLLRVLSGVQRVWSGEVRIGGTLLGTLGASERARVIAYAGQRVSQGLSMTVREVVGFGCYGEGMDTSLLGETLARFELEGLADEPTDRLSVGQQQRVSIARAEGQLGGADHERYLILDEPIASMDPRYAIGTMDALQTRCASGLGVCVVLHDLTMVTRWADRVVLLDARGALVRSGLTDAVMCPDVLREVYGVRMSSIETPLGRVLLPMQDERDRMEPR
jgi:ABC-type hemin transport system ATPase subunit